MTRKKSSASWLAGGQRRDLWGISLLALAVLLLLSLIPLSLFGAGAAGVFPAGNIVGVLGRAVSSAGWGLLGAAAVFLPVLPAVWGLFCFHRLDREAVLRLTVLVAGLVLLLPAAIFAAARPLELVPASAGWLGSVLGGGMVDLAGWFGALLLGGFLFAALCVATTGWNPLRPGARWAVAGFRHTAGALGRLVPRRESEPAGAAGSQPEETEPERDVEPAEAPIPYAHPSESTAVAPEIPAEGSDQLPDPSLLEPAPPRDEEKSRQKLDELGRVLIEKLATFRLQGELVGRTTGPVVTQFEVSPAPGVKVSKIANLEPDLALALRAPSVRIVAPIPGKGAVGVEVPNPEPDTVYFREVLESYGYTHSRALLPLALGKDLSGRPYVADLAKMPHLLIAGATGSGKSVCINTLVTSLIYRYPPRRLRFLMVDPKMVELSMYNQLPHLRHPVVTDNQEAASVLRWAILEMERRYRLLSANGVRNLSDFNRRLESGHEMVEVVGGDGGAPPYQGGPLPYVVVVIDELADLMMTVQSEVERPLALLAQKARAIGIHLILATQRPSVNVITGLIKANFPSRIAFRVSSKIDARTIMDQSGADNLLGNGDMLFLPPGRSDPVRIQGAFLSTEETERLMAWYQQEVPGREAGLVEEGEEDILEQVREHDSELETASAEESLEDRDPLFREAAEVCAQNRGGSTSLLQRRMRIGYGRAARIIDQLEYAGVLGPQDGSKPREVLVARDALDGILGG